MRNEIVPANRYPVSPGEPDRVFYAAPAAIARVLCSLFLLAMAAMYAVMFFLMPINEARALLLPLLPLIGVGVLGEIAVAFLLSRLSPIRIGDAGITITQAWGRKRTLSWGEIQSVTPGKCLSVPYMKVSSFRQDRADSALIVPLAVTRPQHMRDSIQHFASPINPARRFLEDGPSARREPLA